jgi:hypothetical protein
MPDCNKTSDDLLIVKSGKGLVGDRGKKIIYVKVKRFIGFWEMKWICSKDQLVGEFDFIFFVQMFFILLEV